MSAGPATMSDGGDYRVPTETLGRLFLRFLRFGSLAWGGPVAQIAMIRQELVEEERWVSSEHFNRVLAVYQVLPGPEAHEMCVYFGMLARGRIGGILAGLGFMLPGFVLMFLLSWAYVRYGLQVEGVAAVFAAVQAAVAALIVRAVFRIGGHVLTDRWTWGLAALATVAQLAGVHFAVTLSVAGGIYVLTRHARPVWAFAATVAAVALGVAWFVGGAAPAEVATTGALLMSTTGDVPLLKLFWSGLMAGLLTFGGAYTVIPFLQRDAVSVGGWMSDAQFLDGLALSGLLPAPLIIFATFVGYIGGGPLGAVALTVGVFLPAFAFTLVGHDFFDRIVHLPRVKLFLDGVTAGVVGLIAGTTLGLMRVSLTGIESVAIFLVALFVLFRWKGKMAIPTVVAAAVLWGVLSVVIGR